MATERLLANLYPNEKGIDTKAAIATAIGHDAVAYNHLDCVINLPLLKNYL